jgi:ABC-type nitrate/sulfonate/bicarbonate transport system substrate-binding protein
MLRRVVLTAIAVTSLAPLLLAMGPSEQAKGPVLLRVITFVPYPALVVADEHGLFAAENLAVNWEITPSSTVQMQGLTSGRWEIAITSFDNLLASHVREGVRSVAFAMADRIDLPFYVRPEIATYDDLRGRPLAVDAVDTAFALVLRRLLLAHGLDLNRGDYTLVGAGAPQQRLDSITRGETVGGILNPPWNILAEQAGLRQLGHHSEVLPDYPGSVLAATADWLADPEHRAAVVRFLRAWQRGAEWAVSHREATRELLARVRNVPPAAADNLLDATRTDLSLDPAGLTSVRDLRVELGLVPPPGPRVEDYYDLTLYAEARR